MPVSHSEKLEVMKFLGLGWHSWNYTVFFLFWLAFRFCCFVPIFPLIRLAIATLDALVKEKMDYGQEEKKQVLSSKIRLMADPAISISKLQEIFTSYLKHKVSKD